jgi:glyoxylase-like metal-dependent hydrolase (beta-lactamase superfamily II)
MQTLDVGGTRIFALTDAAPAPAKCAYSFPDAALAEHADAAARWFPDGAFHTRFGAFLLRREHIDILVDCGVGPGPSAYFSGLAGKLPAALAAAGSSLERIAAVVLTHLHVDHVGWAPFLPGARFFVAEPEWAHWSGLGPAAGLAHHTEAFARCIAPLAGTGRLHPVPAGVEILPGIMLHAAPGHTPGHHAVLLQDRLLIAGDIWHNPAQIEVPAWCHRADMDKPAAIRTRIEIARQVRHHSWIVAAGHFPAPGIFGRIVPNGDGEAFEPLSV